MRFTVVLSAFLLACGGGAAKSADEPTAAAESAPAPEGTAPDSAAVDDTSSDGKVSDEAAARTPVDQAVYLFEQMAAVVTNASDCDQMAADLNAWADSNAAELKRVNEELNASGQVEEVQARMMEKPELVKGVQTAIQPCTNNAAVMEAFMKVQGG